MGRVGRRQTKYLIIGNSAGGIGAAEGIREVDTKGSVLIVSDEPYPTYSRPLISEYLARERVLDQMLFRPRDFYECNNIATLLGNRVLSLDLGQQTAELQDGQTVAWEKLLLASGGTPIVPPLEGASKEGVFTFTTLDDAKAIDSFLQDGARAVVIGGGLIGISVTEALVKRGAQVSVVEMKDRVLNVILDEQASGLAARALWEAGVQVMTDHTVARVLGDGRVQGVVLDDGTEVPCDLVVVAIGVLPRTELARSAGIKLNRGIVVDQRLATSHPDVYACGDVAEAYDFIYGASRLTPIWPNAYIGGRVAGRNMAGTIAKYPGGTAMNSLKYFGLPIAAAGLSSPPADAGYEVLRSQRNGTYRCIVLKDDLVVGMVFVDDIEKSGIVLGLMKDRVNVRDFKEAIVADDFGLASMPRPLWEERLGLSSTQALSRVSLAGEADEELGGD